MMGFKEEDPYVFLNRICANIKEIEDEWEGCEDGLDEAADRAYDSREEI